MGAADIVPGVSGGTVALITGIYKKLLESINNISTDNIKLARTVGFKAVWKKINGPFLLAVFGGILSSILVFSRILEWLIKNEPLELWSFFFGLICLFVLISTPIVNTPTELTQARELNNYKLQFDLLAKKLNQLDIGLMGQKSLHLLAPLEKLWLGLFLSYLQTTLI